jgi:hypothetical protein
VKPPNLIRYGFESPKVLRKQMVMQLPGALISDLKRRVLEQQVNTGKRVTQQ